MKVFEIGSTVYAAWLWSMDSTPEVESATVVASTEKQLRLSARLAGLGYMSTLRDPARPPATTERGALEHLRADVECAVEAAESRLREARKSLAIVDERLRSLKP